MTEDEIQKECVFWFRQKYSEWCADNASTFASYTATKEEWMKMLDSES